MSVALAGGTGFTGRRVAALLAADGADLRCLVRPSSDGSVLPQGVELVEGDLGDAEALDRWLAGARALVYCASMGFGHVPGVIAAAERAGVRRGVFLSTTALFTTLSAASKEPRTAAEQAVRESPLDWTILRPTMIYGAPGDRNMERLLGRLARWPLLPVPGGGRGLIQPVHVDDLAGAVVSALVAEVAVGRDYEISGLEPLTFDRAVALAAHAVGRKGRRVHLPLTPVVLVLRALESLGLRLPVKSEQVLRLAEDKAFAHAAAARDFGFAPRSFEEGIDEEARQLGLAPENDG